jgi:hypothetical protein
MTTPTNADAVTREAVRAALIELLTTTDQHHHAATRATLTAVGDTRRVLAELHRAHDPAARHAPDHDRHAALSSALGDIGRALLTTHPHPDPTRLRAGLTVLAAVALGWLDTLPTTTTDHDADGPDAEPF